MTTGFKPSPKLMPSLVCLSLAASLGCGGGSEQSKASEYPTAEPDGRSMPPAATSEEPTAPQEQPDQEQPSEAPPAPSPGAQPSEPQEAPPSGGDPWGSSSQGAPAEPQSRGGQPAQGAGSGAAGTPDVNEQELTQFAKTYAEVVSVQRQHQQKARSAASREELQGIQSSMEEDIQEIIEDSPFSRTRFDTIAKALGQDKSLRSRFEQKMRALQ